MLQGLEMPGKKAQPLRYDQQWVKDAIDRLILQGGEEFAQLAEYEAEVEADDAPVDAKDIQVQYAQAQLLNAMARVLFVNYMFLLRDIQDDAKVGLLQAIEEDVIESQGP